MIRRRRYALGLSVQEAAWRASISVGQWARLELGRWIPDEFDDEWRIAAAIGSNAIQVSFAGLLSRGQ